MIDSFIEGLHNTGPLEGVAVITGILYLLFAAKENSWCWFFAAVSVSIYAYLTFTASLYAEFVLQIYYGYMAYYGYKSWGRGNQREPLKISSLSIKQNALFISLGAGLTILLATLLLHFTDADFPYLDSFTTVFSILTTVLVARKIIDNWLYWIVIDIAACYLYFQKHFVFTSVLYAVYVVLAIIGFINWQKHAKQA